jgi:hypothetical protein
MGAEIAEINSKGVTGQVTVFCDGIGTNEAAISQFKEVFREVIVCDQSGEST